MKTDLPFPRHRTACRSNSPLWMGLDRTEKEEGLFAEVMNDE